MNEMSLNIHHIYQFINLIMLFLNAAFEAKLFILKLIKNMLSLSAFGMQNLHFKYFWKVLNFVDVTLISLSQMLVPHWPLYFIPLQWLSVSFSIGSLLCDDLFQSIIQWGYFIPVYVVICTEFWPSLQRASLQGVVQWLDHSLL